MDLLDKVTKALAEVGKVLPRSFFDAHPGLEKEMTEALTEFKRDREKTIVLTFERATNKDASSGPYAVLFTDEGDGNHDVLFTVCNGVNVEDGDFASCVMPNLPGPEVFREGGRVANGN